VAPPVAARRRRQNRLIVAVVVAVLVPVLAIGGANRYVKHVMNAWTDTPVISLNTPTTVYLGSARHYVVWIVSGQATCTVAQDGTPLPVTVPTTDSTLRDAGYFGAAEFTAPTAGAYEVTCTSASASGYAMVSTPSPITGLGLILLGGYAVAAIGVIVGLSLFIMALATRRPPPRPTPPPASPYPPPARW
jgi:hypothetical protein